MFKNGLGDDSRDHVRETEQTAGDSIRLLTAQLGEKRTRISNLQEELLELQMSASQGQGGGGGDTEYRAGSPNHREPVSLRPGISGRKFEEPHLRHFLYNDKRKI